MLRLTRFSRAIRTIRFMSTEGEAKELTEVEQLQLTIKERDTQIAQLQDVYRRALADQENMRQRTQRELVDKEQFAIQKFAKQLLDTADVLSMALDAVPETKREENQDLKNLWVGVDLTRKELLKTFKHFGVEPYDPMGEKFDPNMHTALFQAPMADKEPGTVFHVTKVGYKIKDRVLRSAQVGVVQG